MKKQINPTIKAHLIRGAFYLLLLVAVCAIPFALAQRNATKRSVASSKVTTTVKLAGPQSGTPASLVGTQNRLGAAKPQLPHDLRPLPVAGSGKQVSEEPKTTSRSTDFRTLTILPYPRPPQIVLYDQYDNARFGFPIDIVSQDFEPAFKTYDCFAADDFVVPAGQTWNITEVDVLGEFDLGSAESFNVYFYQDSGSLPGTLVESRPGNSYTGFSDFVITLTSPVTLTPGTYWVAVQSRQDYKPNGQWYWHNRDVQSNQGAAWQNPGDGFMTGCTTWIRKIDCAALQEVGPDEVFRLVGTMGGGGTPTPTPTPTLGNYPATVVDLSDNITVTPDAPPTGATSITVSTSTSFNAELTADVTTGVVRLTNAQPAKLPPGAYAVTVWAFGPGGSTTRTFMLTVTTPPACAGITFAAASNFTVVERPVPVAVGDFNGDGVQDLATANWNSANVSVLIGTGTGSFGPASYFAVGTNPASVAVGDFNGDGVQDLVSANSGSNIVSVLIGTGTGSFGAASNFTVGTAPYSVAVGDFNGDGVQDLASANVVSGNVSVLIGTGTGSFGAASDFPVGTVPTSVAVGDFNGDGVQDLAAANAGSNNVSVLIGTGTGSFGPASNFTAGTRPESVAVGDFNGDGVQDLAAANSGSNNVSVLIGTGTGSFGAATNFPAGTASIFVAVGDFNGDGVQDLATANGNSANVSVLIGTGTGSFAPPSNFPVGSTPYSVAVGDLNGDGLQDLAAANSDSNNVSVLLRTCPATPTPTPSPTSTPTATPTATATATASSTPRPTPAPRSQPTPRPRPTPGPRP